MMPNRVVTLHRWQIIAAFVAVTAAFVIGLYFATQASNTAHDAAKRADTAAVQAQALAHENARLIKRERADRLARRRQNVQTLILICRKLNRSNKILSDLLLRIRGLPPTITSAAAARNRRIILMEFARALIKLRPQKCGELPATKKSTAP